jgi:hypothetical protein
MAQFISYIVDEKMPIETAPEKGKHASNVLQIILHWIFKLAFGIPSCGKILQYSNTQVILYAYYK